MSKNAGSLAESDAIGETVLASQLRRLDRLWTRFEETGEDRWLSAAMDADRVYLRMLARAGAQ